jgi:endonuclease YncB( thermonuclease family)
MDTPESRQPYGTRARQELADLTFRRGVRVEVEGTERYGRAVGQVWVGTLNVNAERVRCGAAWVYRQYYHDLALLVLEKEARDAQRGLWACRAERVPPWLWRQQQRR